MATPTLPRPKVPAAPKEDTSAPVGSRHPLRHRAARFWNDVLTTPGVLDEAGWRVVVSRICRIYEY